MSALTTVLEACEAAARKFREYEAMHAKKGNEDKANANGEMATMLEDALEAYNCGDWLK